MIALYFLALFSLSQSANFVRLAHAPPDVIGFWRMALTSVVLLPFALRKWRSFPQWTLAEYGWPMVSALFFFAHLWTFVYAAQHTTIAHCMIIFATNPLFTTLGAYYFLREPFHLRSLPAYGFGLLGLYLLLSQSARHGGQEQVLGDLNALVSAVLFAAYILTGKRSRRHFSNLQYTFIIYLMTGIFFGINGTVAGLDFTNYPPLTWYCIIGTVVLPTLLGHSLFSYLMKFMNVGLMTCGKLVEPLMSSVVAYFLFGESLTLWTFASFSCAMAALVILFWPEIQKARRSRG